MCMTGMHNTNRPQATLSYQVLPWTFCGAPAVRTLTGGHAPTSKEQHVAAVQQPDLGRCEASWTQAGRPQDEGCIHKHKLQDLQRGLHCGLGGDRGASDKL